MLSYIWEAIVDLKDFVVESFADILNMDLNWTVLIVDLLISSYFIYLVWTGEAWSRMWDTKMKIIFSILLPIVSYPFANYIFNK